MTDKASPADHRPADPRSQEYELAPIDSITPHPRNPNQGDVGAIRESIDVNGFYGACIVQKSTRYILAGEHRWRAEKERQQAHVPALFVDVDDETALRILLADNGTRRGARTQEKLVGEILEGLRVRQGTGYKAPDIQALLKKARPVPSYLAAAAQKPQPPAAGGLPTELPIGPPAAKVHPPAKLNGRETEALLLTAELAAAKSTSSGAEPTPANEAEGAEEDATESTAEDDDAEERDAEERAPAPAPAPPRLAAPDPPANAPQRDERASKPSDAKDMLTLRPRIGLRGEPRHPLAIVLDNDGAREWATWKERVGLRKDTEALLLAINILRGAVLPWEAADETDDATDAEASTDALDTDTEPESAP